MAAWPKVGALCRAEWTTTPPQSGLRSSSSQWLLSASLPIGTMNGTSSESGIYASMASIEVQQRALSMMTGETTRMPTVHHQVMPGFGIVVWYAMPDGSVGTYYYAYRRY